MKRRKNSGLIWISAFIVLILIVVGGIFCVHKHSNSNKTVTVGIVGNDKGTAAIWKQVAQTAKSKYGIVVKTKVFTDYNQPNEAVKEGNVDLNAFEHYAFLKNWNRKHDNCLVSIGQTYISPIKIYSYKYKNVKQIPDGATIAIPNDASNESRALFVLKNAGLISLKKSTGTLATVADISSNNKHLKIKELSADQTAHSLNNVAAAIVNNDFVKPAKLTNKEAIYTEPINKDSKQWINLIVADKKDKNKRVYKDVVKAYQTKQISKLYKKYYGNLDIPAWNK